MNKLSLIRMAILSLVLSLSAVFAGEGNGGPITADQAREIAFAQTGGGEVLDSGQYSRGYGIVIYRFEIMGPDGKCHVEIDGGSGAIVKFIRKGGYRGYRRPGMGSSGMTGTGGGTAGTGMAENPPSTPPSGGHQPGKDANGSIGQEQALSIAMARTGGGTVVKSKINRKRYGQEIYEYEIYHGGMKYGIEVDGTSGEIVKFKQKRKDGYVAPQPSGQGGTTSAPSSGRQAVEPQPRLTAEAAQAIAIEKIGGGTVRKYEVDRDDGRFVHELELFHDGYEYEVEIDDASGAILELSRD